MTLRVLTEHYLELLSLKGGYTGWSESTHVNMPHCWKSQSSTADPGVASSMPARFHTLVEIDHKIISTVILLPSAE